MRHYNLISCTCLYAVMLRLASLRPRAGSQQRHSACMSYLLRRSAPQALGVNKTLQNLSLQGNEIGDEGVLARPPTHAPARAHCPRAHPSSGPRAHPSSGPLDGQLVSITHKIVPGALVAQLTSVGRQIRPNFDIFGS